MTSGQIGGFFIAFTVLTAAWIHNIVFSIVLSVIAGGIAIISLSLED